MPGLVGRITQLARGGECAPTLVNPSGVQRTARPTDARGFFKADQRGPS